MNEAHVTVIGWLAQDPFYTMTANGTPFLALRVGCTPRRYDRQTGQWQDQESMFLTVNCWRSLAENVNASDMRRGEPVIVSGRLRVREYVKDGRLRFSAEVEATTVGHDLSRGSAQFRRIQRGTMTEEDRLEARDLTDQWSLTADPPDPEDATPGPSDDQAGPQAAEALETQAA
ncbi:single-stranded DNA-binding protein [Thermomonospora cellulosilytica]|uniref:Single-stranded DNA-binding protein n=1 Tax=Thermomonospora cellulosilytica TaxID=1411118 RepID=A0A7W3R8Y8_9ACTN|nr:single-stranded DNA-binding protein [Thermomonospora cellulosilytica]MBA9004079.1 single-strand DNA-binding protein [Thermomonospora cellulosilytica]